MKTTFVALICVILSGSFKCFAQTQQRSIPHAESNRFKYLLVTATVFKAANLVDTERTLPQGKQQLSILNISMPLIQAARGSFSMHPSLVAASTMLITLAIIPDKLDKQVHWQPIRLDTLAASQQINPTAFIDTCFQKLARYHRTGGQAMQDNYLTRSASVRPIIHRDGQYWTTSNYTLTELFLVCPVPFILPYETDNVTISVLARPYSAAQLEKEWSLEQNFYQGGRGGNLNLFLSSKLLLEKK
jgi:hypothetical protein